MKARKQQREAKKEAREDFNDLRKDLGRLLDNEITDAKQRRAMKRELSAVLKAYTAYLVNPTDKKYESFKEQLLTATNSLPAQSKNKLFAVLNAQQNLNNQFTSPKVMTGAVRVAAKADLGQKMHALSDQHADLPYKKLQTMMNKYIRAYRDALDKPGNAKLINKCHELKMQCDNLLAKSNVGKDIPAFNQTVDRYLKAIEDEHRNRKKTSGNSAKHNRDLSDDNVRLRALDAIEPAAKAATAPAAAPPQPEPVAPKPAPAVTADEVKQQFGSKMQEAYQCINNADKKAGEAKAMTDIPAKIALLKEVKAELLNAQRHLSDAAGYNPVAQKNLSAKDLGDMQKIQGQYREGIERRLSGVSNRITSLQREAAASPVNAGAPKPPPRPPERERDPELTQANNSRKRI